MATVAGLASVAGVAGVPNYSVISLSVSELRSV